MHRNTDCAGLVCNGARYRLTYPPGGIRTEFISFVIIEFFYGFDKTEIAFLDEVQKQHAASYVTFGNADYKTKIGFGKTLLRFHVAFLHAFGEFDFFVCG